VARELTILVKADGSQAKSEFAAVEKGITGITNASAKADTQVQKQVDHQAESARKIGAALGSIFSIQKISAAVDQVSASTSRIADAAARIGITAEAVQKLGFAASQGGSSIEAVAVAMGRMSDMLGTEGAADKLAKIGLTLEDIKGLTPDQTFLAMAEAIRGMEDPIKQADAATDVFGRGALELMPAIKAGFVEVGDQAPLMSNAVVASGDASGDALQRMRGQMDALKAKALVPLMEAFTALPESVQIGVAGILSFMPSLEGLALAIMAAGGPTAALGLLKGAAVAVGTFFSATLPGLFAGAITFFTTTLPAAIGTVLTFLGPQGLIALAVLAVVAIWYFFGDEIAAVVKKVYGVVKEWLIDKLGALWGTIKTATAAVVGYFGDLYTKAVDFAKRMYEGIKAWLVDKIGAVFASLKGKIDAVTGYFKGMYDAVVGNSYVPDMVRGIATEFGKLDRVMVNPTIAATGRVESGFRSMADKVRNLVTGLISDISSSLTTWADKYLPSWAANIVGKVAEFGLNAIMNKVMGGDGDDSDSSRGGWRDIFGGGNGGSGESGEGQKIPSIDLLKIGVDLVKAGIKKLGDKLRGGEEGMFVNPARDTYFQQFQAEFGGNQFEALAKAFADAGVAGDVAERHIAMLYGADTMQEFNAAVSTIDRKLADSKKKQEAGFADTTQAAETMVARISEGFDRLIAKLDAFFGRISAVGGALGTIGLPGPIAMPVVSDNPLPGVVIPDSPDFLQPVPMASGGRGMVTKPTLFLAGESGAEEYAFSGAGKRFSGGGGGTAITIQPGAIVVNGAGKNPEQTAREIVKHIKRYNVGGTRRHLTPGIA
jgi:hypothetical protein